MANTSNNNKLDKKIKQSLSNYKATNSVVDWSRMEEMLDSAPRANTFKWNYLFSALLGIIIVGGAYFMYDSLSYSKLNESILIDLLFRKEFSLHQGHRVAIG